MTRWKIRKTSAQWIVWDPDGAMWDEPVTRWTVYEPDGTWSGDFADWPLAVVWATDITARIEHWLQTRRLDQ